MNTITTATTIQLPYDVWSHVARFLPPDILCDLYAVNHVFFDLAMNERYRKVEVYSASRKTLQMLRRLSDPALSSRVRCFCIDPYRIQRMLVQQRIQSRQPRVPVFIRHIINRIGPTRKSGPDKGFQSTDEISRAMLDVTSRLSQVTEYVIVWMDRSSIKLGPEEYISPPLLAVIRSMFTPTVKNLTLQLSEGASPELFYNLRSPQGMSMINLDTLSVTLYEEESRTVEGKYDLLVDLLCPFIRSLSATIRHLSISILYRHVKYSLLFKGLGNLPHLNRLELITPFNEGHLSNLPSFRDFLDNHTATLQHLSLTPSKYTTSSQSRSDSLPLWDVLGQNCFPSVAVGQARSLQQTMRFLSWAKAESDGLSSLRGILASLVSLSVLDHSCVYDDIAALTSNPVGPNLTDLTIAFRRLSPQVVDMLARSLPQLRGLNMAVMDVIHTEDPSPILPDVFRFLPQDMLQLELFSIEMRKRRYPAWALEHLCVWCMLWLGVSSSRRVKEAISQCVPGLSHSRSAGTGSATSTSVLLPSRSVATPT